MQYSKYKFGVQPMRDGPMGTRTSSTADYHERIVEARNVYEAQRQIEAQYPKDGVRISSFGEVR